MERLTEWSELSHKHAYYPRCFEDPCYGSGCKIGGMLDRRDASFLAV